VSSEKPKVFFFFFFTIFENLNPINPQLDETPVIYAKPNIILHNSFLVDITSTLLSTTNLDNIFSKFPNLKYNGIIRVYCYTSRSDLFQ